MNIIMKSLNSVNFKFCTTRYNQMLLYYYVLHSWISRCAHVKRIQVDQNCFADNWPETNHILCSIVRSSLFTHMASDHGFNVGLPDNLGEISILS